MPNLQILLKYHFEQLASDKSKLPKGYVYVPKGDVYVTRRCRLLTGDNGNTLYIVYDEKTKERLGLRCPVAIYEAVLKDAKSSALKRQENVLARDRRDLAKAKIMLLKLFPRIPSEDSHTVLAHAFLKGSGRVGRTTTLSDDRKLTNAVAAHIRHTKTPYEALLKKGRKSSQKGTNENLRSSVRRQVQGQLDKILGQWGPEKRPIPPRDDPTASRNLRAYKRGGPLSETGINSLHSTGNVVSGNITSRINTLGVSMHAIKKTEIRTRSSDSVKVLTKEQTQIVGGRTSILSNVLRHKKKCQRPRKGPKSRNKPLHAH